MESTSSNFATILAFILSAYPSTAMPVGTKFFYG
jgi:hypothetical protein